MLKSAREIAVSIRSVSVRNDDTLVSLEYFPDSLGLHFENLHHKAPHQECSVGFFVILVRAVVIQFHAFVFRIYQKSNKLSDVLVDLS